MSVDTSHASPRRAALRRRCAQIDAGVLDVGYVDAGPADGPAVLLLHGWPYDIHSFAEVAPILVASGYRVIVPYLRGYGTTRFLSDDTLRNGEQAALAVDAIALMDALDDRAGRRRRVRLGCAHGRHRGRALAGALQRPGLGQRLPDRQPGGRPAAAAARGRAAVVVPVLLRDRARAGGLRRKPARVRQADLADRVAAVGVRRRHVRPQRGVVRQPRPRRHRDPQLPLAARARRRRAAATTTSRHGSPTRPTSRCRRSRWKATPTARRIPSRAPTRRSSPARTRTARSTAASGTTCPRRPRRRSPMRSSR